MKIAVYNGITGTGKRFECYTILKEIEGYENKDKVRKIIAHT